MPKTWGIIALMRLDFLSAKTWGIIALMRLDFLSADGNQLINRINAITPEKFVLYSQVHNPCM
jgi:hypothetical protein